VLQKREKKKRKKGRNKRKGRFRDGCLDQAEKGNRKREVGTEADGGEFGPG
jgi:hypothetical protein